MLNKETLKNKIHTLYQRFLSNDNHLLLLSAVLWFNYDLLRVSFKTVFQFLHVGFLTTPIILLCIYYPLFLYMLKHRLDSGLFFKILLGVIFLFGVSLLAHPDYWYWYNRSVFGVLDTVLRPDKGAIWGLFFILLLKTKERILQFFKYGALVSFVYHLVLLLQRLYLGYFEYVNASGITSHRSYSLEFGYGMLFILLVCLFFYKKEKNKAYLIISGISLFSLFQYSGRGSQLILLIALGLLCINYELINKEMGKKIGIGALVLVVICFLFSGPLLQLMSHIPFLSRTGRLILKGNIFSLNGRDRIYSAVWQTFIKHPILGVGLYGDRPVVGPIMNWGYSHNIILEFMIDLGVIGLALILLYFYGIIRYFITSKDKEMKYILIVLTSLVLKLMMSGTFWGDVYFWMLLGVLLIIYEDKIPVIHFKNEPKKIKYLHILGSSCMFTKDYYNMLTKYFDPSEHTFLGHYTDTKGYNKNGPDIIESRSLKMPLYLYKAEYIFIHGLFNEKIIIFLFLQPWLLKKCNWIAFGADIYSHDKTMSKKKKMIEFMKSRIVRYIPYISTFSNGDYPLIQKWYHVDAVNLKASYPLPGCDASLVEELRAQKDDHEELRIIVGNSATETNEHFGALDLLSKFKDENITIYLPLNYGIGDYKGYREKVLDYAYKLFPEEKIHPLLDKLPGDEYLRFLKEMDVGVFNNNRQQGMGNITQLVLFGAKVYIRTDTNMMGHYHNLGCDLYDIDEIKYIDTLSELVSQSEERQLQNIEAMSARQDMDLKVSIWTYMFNVVEGKEKGDRPWEHHLEKKVS